MNAKNFNLMEEENYSGTLIDQKMNQEIEKWKQEKPTSDCSSSFSLLPLRLFLSLDELKFWNDVRSWPIYSVRPLEYSMIERIGFAIRVFSPF